MSKTFTVADGAAAMRLDVFLAESLRLTRSQARHLIDQGVVTVSERPRKPSFEVTAGDEVFVADPPEQPKTASEAPPLPVVYEDEDILVVDKPAGLSVHPSATGLQGPTVVDFAKIHSVDPDPDRPGIVHRLDKDTSGLLIIAKTAAAKAYMQAQFKARKVKKAYLLMAVGALKPPAAVIDLPLGRSEKEPLKRAVVPTGKEAQTAYATIANLPGYSYIEAKPTTGRTHQIRAHFASLGHPVAGDVMYGPVKRPLGLTRQFLHAAKLEFTTPSGNNVSLVSPLPEELAAVLHKLEAPR